MVLRLISLSNANVDIFDRFLEDTKLRDLSIRPNTSLFRQRQSEHDTFKEYPALILIFLHAAKLNHVFSLAFEAYDPLPESVALPSARLFVECFCRALGKEAFAESRTWQVLLSVTIAFAESRTLGTEIHSAKMSLPSAKHSAKAALGKRPSAAVYS
jgi:hypothetical protein